ncbi:MAG: thiamine pyrophosphate-dependent enzyme [Coriobacteriia bacterium]|nr:thiamine pyrophosphate-dependent enzyme [Coriobacteriia bacterium]
MANIKDLTQIDERLEAGHRLCPGCGASIAVRQVLMAAGDTPVVTGCATGCLEVSTTLFPYTAWNTPFIHNAFENAASTMSGVEAAYKAMKRSGQIPQDKEIKFITFGGDGGTYDIGLQALSGAMERGHDMVYVCYDNGAYMNTGIERSGATPFGAWTTTSEVGEVLHGKVQRSKDLTSIMAAHHIPYVAQASVSHWQDLVTKAEKAIRYEGPAFLNILAPCPRGWRHPSQSTISIAKLGVDTNYWPLFEVDHGVWTLKDPKRPKPLDEFLKAQGRFKHLFKPGMEEVRQEMQAMVDEQMEYLRNRVLGSQYLVKKETQES